MTQRRIGLACALLGCLAAWAQDGAQELPNQNLPNDRAETINGKRVDFPGVMRGAIAACVFGFGKDSTDRVAVWLESLSGDNVNAWSVVNLESAPAVARGALRVSMRKGTPKELINRSLVISKDAEEWKRILEVQKESLPVVVLFDKSGRIAWKRQGTYSASISDALKAKIMDLSAK
jgi:hypothetical protein